MSAPAEPPLRPLTCGQHLAVWAVGLFSVAVLCFGVDRLTTPGKDHALGGLVLVAFVVISLWLAHMDGKWGGPRPTE